MQFLRGLNEQYNNITSHVLMMDPVPSISKIFSYVVQHERQIGGNNVLNGTEIKINNTTVTCSYCKKAGHSESVCFKKHGYPGNNNTDIKNVRYSKRVCSFCGRNGHTIDNCYKKHGFPPGYKTNNKGGNVNSVDTNQEGKTDFVPEGHDFKLSQQQYQALMTLLKQTNGNGSEGVSANQVGSIVSCNVEKGNNLVSLIRFNSHNDSILDSGATDHICCSLSNLLSFNRISPIHVNLPDGTKVQATHSGSAKIFGNLCIGNVLFVPSFSYNLVSISRLVSHSNCIVTFTTNECSIQDKRSTKRIGTTNIQSGMYMIKGEINTREDTPAQACTSAINHDIWHMRLGHPSHKRLVVLNRKFPFIYLPVNSDCDVCHLAKQQKLPFPNSTSYAVSVFDLVHMDIWGPCAVNSMNGDKYFLTIVDDHSRFTWLYLMKSKAETRIHLINFVPMIKLNFRKPSR